MSDTPAAKPRSAAEELEQNYNTALARSGLPQGKQFGAADALVNAGAALAYAEALALVTGQERWTRTASSLRDYVRGYASRVENDIRSGDRAESTMRRYGLRGLR